MPNRRFTEEDCQKLEEIIRHRRDVRGNKFTDKEVTKEVIDRIIYSALRAPSVGYSQPWEFVVIRDESIKLSVKESFEEENEKAKKVFQDKSLYKRLKLEGIVDAPVNIAVFYKPSEEPVLGQTSMKSAGIYSVVCAVQNMWLTARALNIGMGWVSILDENKVKKILNAPKNNQLIAYLCIGYVDHFLERPELEILKWDTEKDKDDVLFFDKYE